MSEGSVLVQQPPETPFGASNTSSTIFQGFNITDSTAHVGHNYVSHTHYHDDSYQPMTLDNLSGLHYHEVHKGFQHLRLANSGSWLLEVDEYLQWRDYTNDEDAVIESASTHSLWAHGPPGVGKTFLASKIIDDLLERTEGRRCALAYLYAKRDRAFEQSVPSDLCSVARQLIETAAPSDRAACYDVLRSHNGAKHNGTPHALLSLLKTLATRFVHVFVVLDALDEFSDDRDDGLEQIKALMSFQKAAGPGVVRLCLTWRQSGTCEALLRPRWQLKLQSSPGDLDAFIRSRIDSSSRLSYLCDGTSLNSHIVAEVTEMSGGILKIASLQMDDIARQINRKGIRIALRSLSNQADVYYQQALDRIESNETFGPAIRRMLGWLLTLKKSLTRAELAQALGIEADTPLEDQPWDLEVHLETLIDMSEGFVGSYPSSRTNDKLERQRPMVSVAGWYSLVIEAARSWSAYAAAAAQDLTSSECDFVLNFPLEHQLLMFCCWHGWPSLIRILANFEHIRPCESTFGLFSPFHIAVSLGWRDTVQALLQSTEFDVNCGGIGAGTCELTDWRKRDSVFKWQTEPSSPGDAFMRVTRWNTQIVLRRQLAMDEDQREALRDQDSLDSWYAAKRYFLRAQTEPPCTQAYMIRLMGTSPIHLAVDYRRDHTEEEDVESWLRVRLRRHDSEMLKLFLNHDGVNVNAIGFAGLTPLFVAIHNADVEAVLALLAHKLIDVNLVTHTDHALSFTIHRMCFQRYVPSEQTSLLRALTDGEEANSGFPRLLSIFQLLMGQSTLDVNKGDASGYTPLDWLNFYRSLTTNADLTAFINSEREWIGSTGRDTAACVLEFYEKCHCPFDVVARLLEKRGAQSARAVELNDWLRWFCPLPQRVYDESSDPDEARKREEEGNLDEVYLLRMPHPDICPEYDNSE